MNYTEQVKEIITRKQSGQDCTEEESGYIKQWVKNTIIIPGTGEVQILSGIQHHFPNEYGEALDEMEEDVDDKDCQFCCRPTSHHDIICPENESSFAQLMQKGYD